MLKLETCVIIEVRGGSTVIHLVVSFIIFAFVFVWSPLLQSFSLISSFRLASDIFPS